eukprot:4180938-Alexandrium_andersonii.AAC.1
MPGASLKRQVSWLCAQCTRMHSTRSTAQGSPVLFAWPLGVALDLAATAVSTPGAEPAPLLPWRGNTFIFDGDVK